MMDALPSSEMSVDVYQTTRRYIFIDTAVNVSNPILKKRVYQKSMKLVLSKSIFIEKEPG
jgi:hypothetical protein